MDLYLFDCDKTLYAFDFRKRLPAMARLTDTSMYQLASRWWSPGHERSAEAGEYTTSDAYFRAFRQATDADLTLEKYQIARAEAMTPDFPVIEALKRVSDRGIPAMLSNNPIAFYDSLDILVPDIIPIVGDNRLVSANFGARKPDATLFTAILERYNVPADNAILIDDSAANVAGARAAGLHAFHYRSDGQSSNIDQLNAALDAFAQRTE